MNFEPTATTAHTRSLRCVAAFAMAIALAVSSSTAARSQSLEHSLLDGKTSSDWKARDKDRSPKPRKPRGSPKPAPKEKFRQGKVDAQLVIQSPILSAEKELEGFEVPAGFEVELVASEFDGVGKFVAIAFDAHGRMWTMTALEYPIDANESPELSRQLFARGGRDKVLVYDKPFGDTISRPRVFADGLVMPLGILPYEDGVIVQYGNDIRFYRDTDGDGHADGHEVILTGFGVQDSHLFPHQFTRRPGGWILTAQGLFNRSVVRRPDDLAFADGRKRVTFNQTKLARFTPSGSRFEILTAGPNNIWGLTISREGETWLQEANDLGFPIIPYEPGARYPTGSRERLRPYQPQMPSPLGPPQMGGTGLSGLALADDRDGWPSPWGIRGNSSGKPRMIYVANPITSRIQIIRATPDGGRYLYEKQPDFLISRDQRFRPVAVQFGPDGCLYIVDWYNKIISHNEVPRNHPERDKIRGRIWRIRHEEQSRSAPIRLAKLKSSELVEHLGAPNSRIADLAWQEIVDRQAKDLAPTLQRLIADTKAPADRRLGALWALEGLQKVSTDLLSRQARDDNSNIRHEAIRIAAAQPRPTSEFVSIAAPLVDDAEPKVRAALGDALRHVVDPDAKIIELMARLGRPSLLRKKEAGEKWAAYDREFERYLARWAMEKNASLVADFLQSRGAAKLPLENRALATIALGGRDAALGLAQLIPQLDRPLGEEEVRVLASHFAEPAVADALECSLSNPESRMNTLKALLSFRTDLDTDRLHPAIARAARAIWSGDPSPEERRFALQVIGSFQLRMLEQDIAVFASAIDTTRDLRLAALRALREMGSIEIDTMVKLATDPGREPAVRDAALAVLASSRSPRAPGALLDLLPDLDATRCAATLEHLSGTRAGALALLDAIESGDIDEEDIAISVLGRMNTLLDGYPRMAELWSEYADLLRVLELSGGNDDFVHKPLSIRGPFTVESWVRLSPGISNRDGILGAPGALDLNFADGRFRAWIGSIRRDIVIAKKVTVPGAWTHYAVTRNVSGIFRIYFNGELDAESQDRDSSTFSGLRIGHTIPTSGGTEGNLAEFRIWNVARSEKEIRDNFDRGFSGASHPDGLVLHLGGKSWGRLNGKARMVPSRDAPKLLTAAEARAQHERFAKFRALAESDGEQEPGKALFMSLCSPCHRTANEGGQIGPVLDGAGLRGTEALLRNLLTPSAAMEGGYRVFQVLTKDGNLLEGLLVSRDADAIVLRKPDTADIRVSRSNVLGAEFTAQSLMPEGLLEALEPRQVSDLFAHLRSLR